MAVTCILDRDILRSNTCDYSLPEISDIYVANYNAVTGTGIDSGTTGCQSVSSITLSPDEQFYHIEPARNSISFSDELVVGDSGNKYRTHTLSFTVSAAYDACMHGVLDALSLGRFAVVVKTADGGFLWLGRLTGMEAEASSLAGGAEGTNGMTFTLSANVTESAMPLTGQAIDKVLGKE